MLKVRHHLKKLKMIVLESKLNNIVVIGRTKKIIVDEEEICF